MNDAGFVHGLDGACDLLHHGDCGPKVGAVAFDLPRQRPARGQQHRVAGLALVVADGVNRHDVWVMQPRARACLAEEPGHLVHRQGVGLDLFQRDHPVEGDVAGAVHDAHAALTKLVEDLVLTRAEVPLREKRGQTVPRGRAREGRAVRRCSRSWRHCGKRSKYSVGLTVSPALRRVWNSIRISEVAF